MKVNKPKYNIGDEIMKCCKNCILKLCSFSCGPCPDYLKEVSESDFNIWYNNTTSTHIKEI